MLFLDFSVAINRPNFKKFSQISIHGSQVYSQRVLKDVLKIRLSNLSCSQIWLNFMWIIATLAHSLLNWPKTEKLFASFTPRVSPKVTTEGKFLLSPSTRTHQWPPAEWESFMGHELPPPLNQLITATCQVCSYVSLNMAGQGNNLS